MTSKNYVQNVLRTDCPVTPELVDRISNPQTIRLIHAAFGLATESGEFLDMLKKHIFYGKPLDLVNAKEELGDTMWYVGMAIDVLKTTLDEVMTINIDKLKLRYPEKFTEHHAENRDLESERNLLEAGTTNV
jgi:NTP pyrophosphatase (non-canonical NTP hydrolase)